MGTHARHLTPGLRYVNFPDTEFVAPKNGSLILLPVECGFKHHEVKFLRQIIEWQRQAQREFTLQRDNQETPEGKSKSVLPEATIGEARIVSQKNEFGHREFFVHLPVKIRLSPMETNPESVMGVHEHPSGYSYAILGLKNGQVKYGDIPIPQHVQPKPGTQYFSENYAFEVANAIVTIARQHNAYVGFEDTTWKKRPSLSRHRNRRLFTRPTKKLADALQYKLLRKGLLPIRAVRGVSPSRDCGQCGEELLKGDNGVGYDRLVRCPLCADENMQHLPQDNALYCTSCEHTWNEIESLFVCRHCTTRRLARYNTAIAAAVHTLNQLLEHYERSLEKRKEYAK